MNPVLSTDEKRFATAIDLPTLQSRIRLRLDALDISEREASRRAGFGLGYVGDIMSGRSSSPETSRLMRLAEVLECTLDFLIGKSTKGKSTGEPRSFAPTGKLFTGTQRLIDLYAAPSLTNERWPVLTKKAVDKVPVIPPLVNVRGAYAYSISTSLMEPRYYAGEIIYLNPAITARHGDFVFVRRKDGRATVARFQGIEDGEMKLFFLHATAPVERVPVEDVDYIHRIVGSAG